MAAIGRPALCSGVPVECCISSSDTSLSAKTSVSSASCGLILKRSRSNSCAEEKTGALPAVGASPLPDCVAFDGRPVNGETGGEPEGLEGGPGGSEVGGEPGG
jgi:hypothetical protein